MTKSNTTLLLKGALSRYAAFSPFSERETAATCTNYLNEWKLLSKHRGNLQATKDLKEFYNSFKMFALCQTLPPHKMWRKTGRYGLPSKLGLVIPPSYDNGDIRHVRWMLSILSSYEVLREETVKADIKTLCSPQVSDISPQLKEELKKFIMESSFSRKVRRIFLGKDFNNRAPNFWTLTSEEIRSLFPVKDHWTLKGAPLGKGVLASHHDAKALLAHPTAQSSVAFIEGVREIVVRLEKLATMSTREGTLPLLKTVGIADKGGKVRTVTSANYFIQRALKPVHDRLMSTLRFIREDGTYCQDAAALNVGSLTKDTTPWCYDLTAATDRFPVEIQKITLESLLPGMGEWWESLVKHQSFSPDHNKWINFSVGQPMGVYTSWPLFTLTHHLVVRFAFNRVGQSPNGRYAILGDDIAIFDENAALMYKELIVGLGVSISESKSVIPSRKSCETNSAEFAKRYFRNGLEISPLRPEALLSMKGRGWPLLTEQLTQIKARWSTMEWEYLCSPTSPGSKPRFLSWVDKAHRNKAFLCALAPLGNATLYSEGIFPSPWPDPKGYLFLDSLLETGYTKLTALTGLLHEVVQLSEERILSLVEDTSIDTDLKLHPLHTCLQVYKEAQMQIYRDMANGTAVTHDVYRLGVDLEIAKKVLMNPRKAVDYSSDFFKKRQAFGESTMDLWKHLTYEQEWVPPFQLKDLYREQANLQRSKPDELSNDLC